MSVWGRQMGRGELQMLVQRLGFTQHGLALGVPPSSCRCSPRPTPTAPSALAVRRSACLPGRPRPSRGLTRPHTCPHGCPASPGTHQRPAQTESLPKAVPPSAVPVPPLSRHPRATCLHWSHSPAPQQAALVLKTPPRKCIHVGALKVRAPHEGPGAARAAQTPLPSTGCSRDKPTGPAL